MDRNQLNQIAAEVIHSAIAVHKYLGPGLLESVYEHCLMKELELNNIPASRQVVIPLHYRGFELEKSY
ncbi:MAG: GxxExxY protein, partial [Bacteroidetes bacterium]